MMVSRLSFELRAVICKAASHLTDFQRRLFAAQVAIEYSQASPPQAESMFGFNRRAVARGLQELELGKPIRIRPENRGRPRIEQQRPDIVSHTDALLSENSQVDPKFQTTLALTRVTGNELHGALATTALLRSKIAASRQVVAAGETKFASSCFATHGHPLRLAYSLQFCGFAGTFILSRCLRACPIDTFGGINGRFDKSGAQTAGHPRCWAFRKLG